MEPRDFSLGERATDPADPDGKLDLAQVQGIGIADPGQLFGTAAGAHVLLISGFEVLRDPLAQSDPLAIDSVIEPQMSWATSGKASFRRDGRAIEVAYTDTDDKLVFFIRSLPPAIPAGITHLSFDIASEKPAQLAFAIQLKGQGHGEGPRFNTIVEVRGGGKLDHRHLALSALNLDQNGPPDTGGGFDVTRAKMLLVGDISGVSNATHGPNKLRISNLRFSSAQAH